MGEADIQTSLLFQNSGFRFGETGNKEDEELLKKLETGEAAPEVPKKKTNRISFKPELFCEPNGLKLLKTELSKTRFKKGHEISNLKRLLRKYKEWSNNLYPQRFEAAIHKFEKLSGKILVQAHLQKLRDQRDGISPDEPLVHSDDDIMQEIERQSQTNNPPPFPPANIDDMPPPDLLDEMIAESESAPPPQWGFASFKLKPPIKFGAKKKKPPLFGAKKSGGFLFGSKKKGPLLFGAKVASKPIEKVDKIDEDLDALLEDIESFGKKPEVPKPDSMLEELL